MKPKNIHYKIEINNIKPEQMKKLKDYTTEELNQAGIMYDPWTKTEIALIVIILVQLGTLAMAALHIINSFM